MHPVRNVRIPPVSPEIHHSPTVVLSQRPVVTTSQGFFSKTGGFFVYSMKEACTLTNMTYETLKFYCNEGLVPNVKRDKRNYRVFDEHDIKWIQSLNCLKSCGMSIAEMKQYLALHMEGEGTIPERKVILAEKKKPCSNPLRNCKRQWHTLAGSRDSMTMCCQARQRITVTLFRNC